MENWIEWHTIELNLKTPQEPTLKAQVAMQSPWHEGLCVISRSLVPGSDRRSCSMSLGDQPQRNTHTNGPLENENVSNNQPDMLCWLAHSPNGSRMHLHHHHHHHHHRRHHQKNTSIRVHNWVGFSRAQPSPKQLCRLQGVCRTCGRPLPSGWPCKKTSAERGETNRSVSEHYDNLTFCASENLGIFGNFWGFFPKKWLWCCSKA